MNISFTQQEKPRMFDIHSHILFGIDDGSKSIDMSLDMLKSACQQGITDIVCSSHSWGNLELYDKNFSTLQQAVVENNLPVNLYKGNELACAQDRTTDLTERLADGSILSVADSGYILIEFLPWITVDEALYTIRELKKATVKATGKPAQIIVAHVERYFEFHTDESIIRQLEELGCLLQINVYSLVKEKDTAIKEFARRMLMEKKVSFIGSDAHRSDHRPIDVADGLEYIYANCDKDYADAVCYKNAENYFK